MKYDSSHYNYEMIKCYCDSFDYDDRTLRLPNVPHIFPHSNDKDGITRIAAETARIPHLAVAIFFDTNGALFTDVVMAYVLYYIE